MRGAAKSRDTIRERSRIFRKHQHFAYRITEGFTCACKPLDSLCRGIYGTLFFHNDEQLKSWKEQVSYEKLLWNADTYCFSKQSEAKLFVYSSGVKMGVIIVPEWNCFSQFLQRYYFHLLVNSGSLRSSRGVEKGDYGGDFRFSRIKHIYKVPIVVDNFVSVCRSCTYFRLAIGRYPCHYYHICTKTKSEVQSRIRRITLWRRTMCILRQHCLYQKRHRTWCHSMH